MEGGTCWGFRKQLMLATLADEQRGWWEDTTQKQTGTFLKSQVGLEFKRRSCDFLLTAGDSKQTETEPWAGNSSGNRNHEELSSHGAENKLPSVRKKRNSIKFIHKNQDSFGSSKLDRFWYLTSLKKKKFNCQIYQRQTDSRKITYQ